MINHDIEIVVVEIRGDKVRLGIVAPRETPVHRREVYEAIKRSQAAETCCICGSQEDLKTVPLIASNNANGRKWCMACFTIWYDEGVTDLDEILKRRKEQDSLDTTKTDGAGNVQDEN